MDECVVERGKYSGHAEDEFALEMLEWKVKGEGGRAMQTISDLRSKGYVLSGRAFNLLFGRHVG